MSFRTIFRKETLNESRRLRQYLLRVAYVLFVFGLLVLVNRNELFNLGAAGERATQVADKLSNLARSLYQFTAMTQILAALLLTPVLVTSAFQAEKRHGTLELLSITRLKDRDIVLGKVLSRFLLMSLLIMAGLPVLTMVKVFGVIDLESVLGNFFSSLSAMMIAGSIAAYYGLTSRNLLQAIGYTYAVLAGYCLVTFVGGYVVLLIVFNSDTVFQAWMRQATIYVINPVYAQYELIARQTASGADQWITKRTFGVVSAIQLMTCGLVSWFYLMRAEQQYRWWRLGISSQGQAAEYQRERQHRARAHATETPTAGNGDSFDMQERALARRGRLRLFERGVLIAVLAVEGIALLASFDTNPDVHRVSLSVQFLILAVAACVIGGASIAQEQEDRTLVVLLTTPLEPAQILWGKVRSLVRILTVPVLVMAGHAFLYTIALQITLPSLLLVLVVVPVFLALILVLSLIISSRIPRAGRAITYALATVLLVTLGTFMVGVLIGAAGSPDPLDPVTVTGETIRTLNPVVLLAEGIQPGPGSTWYSKRSSGVETGYLLRSLAGATVLLLVLYRLLIVRFNAWVRRNI